jgi:hypothetical protein
MKEPENLNEFVKYQKSLASLFSLIKEHNIPEDASFVVERVEDVYFEKHGWQTIKFCENPKFPEEKTELVPINSFSYNKNTNTIIVWLHY